VSKNGIDGIATGGGGTMAIKANTVFQNGSGITTNGVTATVENNKVSGNAGAGIATTTGGSKFTSNNAKSNGGADCSDSSTGSGTAGTANIWTGNYGLDPTPAGICKK
jgi:parallel beta-helix repeat protein